MKDSNTDCKKSQKERELDFIRELATMKPKEMALVQGFILGLKFQEKKSPVQDEEAKPA